MDTGLLYALALCETDIDGALRRFAGNETVYAACLQGFLTDTTMAQLDEALQARAWDDAFTAAHALKGLAGNLGFVPLFHATAELVVHIRAGRIAELEGLSQRVRRCYIEITGAIRRSGPQAGSQRNETKGVSQ